MTRDRRRVARHEANLFADLESRGGQALGRAVITNVSVGGVGVETQSVLPLDEGLVCHIEFPIDFRATVVRRGDGALGAKQYGLQFEGLTFLEKLLIRRILKGRLKTRKVTP